jgi:hypothetical protein
MGHTNTLPEWQPESTWFKVSIPDIENNLATFLLMAPDETKVRDDLRASLKGQDVFKFNTDLCDDSTVCTVDRYNVAEGSLRENNQGSIFGFNVHFIAYEVDQSSQSTPSDFEARATIKLNAQEKQDERNRSEEERVAESIAMLPLIEAMDVKYLETGAPYNAEALTSPLTATQTL